MTKNAYTAERKAVISATDHDHKTLLDRVSRVIVASEKPDPASLKALLPALQTELIAYFDREERLMAKCGDEETAQHHEEHQQLTNEIGEQIKDLEADKGNVSHIARFMRNWLLHHLVSKDVLFGKAHLTQYGTMDLRQALLDEIDIFEERRQRSLEAFQWDSAFELGIAAIDANHRAMIATLNAILEARQSSDKTKLATLLEQFGNETATDFQTEEELMSQHPLGNLNIHKEEHRQLLEEFANQVDDWRENRISATFLGRFMYRWLLRHIAALESSLREAGKHQSLI